MIKTHSTKNILILGLIQRVSNEENLVSADTSLKLGNVTQQMNSIPFQNFTF